jgi:hypothetical protein
LRWTLIREPFTLFQEEIEILNDFERVATEIISENIGGIKEYAKSREKHYNDMAPIYESDVFEADLDTFVSIITKYEKIGMDFPGLLGYIDREDFLGEILIGGKHILIDEDYFFTEKGTEIAKNIMDMLDVEYECKACLVRAACKIIDHYDDCDGAYEIIYGELFQDIIAEICKISKNF